HTRGFGERYICIGSDVIRICRQIDLQIVTSQCGDGDILRYVAFRIKLECDSKVGSCFFAVSMQVRAETDFGARRQQPAGSIWEGFGVLSNSVFLDQSLGTVGIDES